MAFQTFITEFSCSMAFWRNSILKQKMQDERFATYGATQTVLWHWKQCCAFYGTRKFPTCGKIAIPKGITCDICVCQFSWKSYGKRKQHKFTRTRWKGLNNSNTDKRDLLVEDFRVHKRIEQRTKRKHRLSYKPFTGWIIFLGDLIMYMFLQIKEISCTSLHLWCYWTTFHDMLYSRLMGGWHICHASTF